MKNKMMWVWILIVLVVVCGLIYLTINQIMNPSSVPVAVHTEGQDVNKNNIQDNKNNMENNTQKSNDEGVQITTLKEGTGEVSKTGDIVAVNYTGALADGTVFDSNVDPKYGHVEAFSFQIGNKGPGGVIEGWNIGVNGMKVGEVRRLVIKPELAYGEQGAGQAIPPNSTLTFDVQLLGIKK